LLGDRETRLPVVGGDGGDDEYLADVEDGDAAARGDGRMNDLDWRAGFQRVSLARKDWSKHSKTKTVVAELCLNADCKDQTAGGGGAAAAAAGAVAVAFLAGDSIDE
jgi:hypothetical protein